MDWFAIAILSYIIKYIDKMRKLRFFALASVGALLLLSSCSKDEPKKDPVTPTPGGGTETPVSSPATAIALKPAELTLVAGKKKQMEVVFTPTNANNKDLVEWDVQHPNVASINDEGVLKAKTEGETVVIARLGKLKAVCKLKVEKKVYPKLKVKVERTYLTAVEARFKITPEDPNLEYFCDITTKEIYNSERTKALGGIIGSNKSFWGFAGGTEKKTTIADWKKSRFYKGALDYSTRPFLNDDETRRIGSGVPVLDWNTDYVFYMFTLDDDGEQSSEVLVREFKTPDIELRKDVTFDIQIKNTTDKSVEVEITPSDPNILYLYHFDKKSWWESWMETPYIPHLGPESSLMHDVLKKDWFSKQFEKGQFSVEKEFYNPNAKERVLVVFGVDRDHGAITGITRKFFRLKD